VLPAVPCHNEEYGTSSNSSLADIVINAVGAEFQQFNAAGRIRHRRKRAVFIQ
jgi:hypothetical protein